MDTQNDNKNFISRFFDGAVKALPVVLFLWTITFSVGNYFLFVRDSQTTSAQSIRDLQKAQEEINKYITERKQTRDREMMDLKNSVVTKELFEERTKTIWDEQLRQRQMLERLLEKQVK